MAGFQKPRPLKASLKIGLYGSAGSGKTYTSLLIAEGLAKHMGKRIAFVDTEYGTNFYTQHVAERAVHPEPFDFDCLYSKSITEVIAAVKSLDLTKYGVIIIDSITHIWDSCKNAFTGKLTKIGTIPLNAWTQIKKPYKDLMNLLLSLPVHVLICGRQGTEYGDDETGELKNLGYKMRAEGETQYEPDILIRLESYKAGRKKNAVPVAVVEKDRTGILAGQWIEWPSFDNIARPLLGLLGVEQVAIPSDDEIGIQDADALARQERERELHSAELAEQYTARFVLTDSLTELKKIGEELTPAVKKQFVPVDLERVRGAYSHRLAKLKPPKPIKKASAGSNGPASGPVLVDQLRKSIELAQNAQRS
jgi:hypothetical protein